MRALRSEPTAYEAVKEPLQIRYYQEEAIHAIYRYLESSDGNGIIGAPGSTGKSVIIAEFLRSIFTYYRGQRALMLTHVKELISQNYDEIKGIWPTAPIGIYSAGLGKKEIHPITFAGIQSVAKKAHLFGHIDLILIDECHLVSPKDETSYQVFINELKKKNPFLRVIGFTATYYRLGQGKLTEPFEYKGKTVNPLFSDIIYDLTTLEAFNRLIREGFISPLVPKRTKFELDVSEVDVVGGDYVTSQLQHAVDRSGITNKALDELLFHARNENRKCWLIFATGVEHAEHIAAELRERGVWAQAIHSKTPKEDRDAWIRHFKKPTDVERCLVTNNVLTTGFNCPQIDLLGILRNTLSTSLWVQLLSRGTRPAPGKKDCLVLDFAGNTRRLGAINDPMIPKPKGEKQDGEARVKECMQCGTYNHAAVRFCTCCGNEFPRMVKFKETAGTDVLIKSVEMEIKNFDVTEVSYRKWAPRHSTKPPSLLVTYSCGPIQKFSEWVCLQHEGFASKKARDWWRERAPMSDDPPSTIDDALLEVEDLIVPKTIKVLVNKTHPQILKYEF